MSTIVWTTVISAVAALTGSLGTVYIKGFYDDRAEARKAAQANAAETLSRRREAYAQLLTTARKALEQARLRQAELSSTGKIGDKFILSPDDLAQVVSLAELFGSKDSLTRVRTLCNEAIDLYGSYLQFAEAVAPKNPRTPPGEGISSPAYPSSDPAPASLSTYALETAVSSFVDKVRPELETNVI